MSERRAGGSGQAFLQRHRCSTIVLEQQRESEIISTGPFRTQRWVEALHFFHLPLFSPVFLNPHNVKNKDNFRADTSYLSSVINCNQLNFTPNPNDPNSKPSISWYMSQSQFLEKATKAEFWVNFQSHTYKSTRGIFCVSQVSWHGHREKNLLCSSTCFILWQCDGSLINCFIFCRATCELILAQRWWWGQLLVLQCSVELLLSPFPPASASCCSFSAVTLASLFTSQR